MESFATAIRDCDILIFTLGLTEAWRNRGDGPPFLMDYAATFADLAAKVALANTDLLSQPEATLTAAGRTDRAFLLGTDDLGHMNADFGTLYLRQNLAVMRARIDKCRS